jgi:hypothetical protein
VSAFTDAWLRLREPLDASSRADALVATLRQDVPDRPLRVIDLATGTGANLRYLSPLLGGAQEWCLIDHDPALLDALPVRLGEWARASGASLRDAGEAHLVSGPGFDCRVRCLRQNLTADAIDVPTGSLVTASALLDLVSEAWLEALARRCLDARAPVLFALTYDGRMQFDPREPEDVILTELVNQHQLTDKGFGPALGPAAGPRALQLFERLGYRVATAPSDWHVAVPERRLQEALLEGWLAAAVEIAPEQTAVLERWAERRRAHVARGRSVLTVGHVDLLGLPPP